MRAQASNCTCRAIQSRVVFSVFCRVRLAYRTMTLPKRNLDVARTPQILTEFNSLIFEANVATCLSTMNCDLGILDN